MHRFLTVVVLSLSLTTDVSKAQTCAATPALFGYNAQPLAGRQPILVVLVDFEDMQVSDLSPSQRRNEAYFDELVFGIRPPGSTDLPKPNVSGLYQATSGGRVSLSRAGMVRVRYPRRYADLPSMNIYDAEVTRLTARAFPIQRFDTNGDHRIVPSELAMVRVVNTPDHRYGGQSRRHTATFSADGLTYTFEGDTFNVDQEGGVSLFAHELFHLFGFPQHIYGPGYSLNPRASFFSASEVGPIVLDPFHRMKAGWTVPRLFDMSASGSTDSAIYSGGPEEASPILLYDRTRCASEFFMLEFRNRAHGSSPYDRSGLGPGVAVWYVRQSPSHSLLEFAWPPPIPAAPITGPTSMVGEFLAGPGGPGTGSLLTRTTPEFSPMWFTAPSSSANVGIEVEYSETGAVAGVQWRPRDQAFVARIQKVQGSNPPPVMRAVGDYLFALDGVFPVRRDGLVVRLASFTRQYPLTLESLTPTRVTVRKTGPVEPGLYQVLMERTAPRAVRTVFSAGAGVRFE